MMIGVGIRYTSFSPINFIINAISFTVCKIIIK